jgi:hypothetical protein
MEKKYVFGWQRMGTIRLEVCGDGRHLRASINREENWYKGGTYQRRRTTAMGNAFLGFLGKTGL